MPTKHLTFHNGQLAKKKMLNAKSPVSNVTGFTLIELLVVISIISILAVVGFSAFTNVTKSARDAKRRADIDAIAKAYEVKYNSDQGKYQPLPTTSFTSGTIPQDPTSTHGTYYNWLANDKSGYIVCAALENGSNVCTQSAANCYCKGSTQGTLNPSSGPYDPTDPSAPSGTIDYSQSATHTDLGPGSASIAPTCDTTGTLTAGLVGYWKMDEAPGAWQTLPYTVAGFLQANNGVASCYGGGCTSRPTTVAGVGPNAGFVNVGQFNGSNSYIRIPNSSTLQLTDKGTVSLWVKPIAYPGVSLAVPNSWGAIINKGNFGSSKDNISIYIASNYNGGTPAYYLKMVANGNSTTSNSYTIPGSLVPLNIWTQLVLVWERSGSNTVINAYVNGNRQTTVPYSFTTPVINTSWDWTIGCGEPTGVAGAPGQCNYYFNGNVDDVRIYNRVLTGGVAGSEISNLYSTGSGCIPQ